MVDFWEIIGRVVTNDAFRAAMYSNFAGSAASPNPDGENIFSCLFADEDYMAARTLVLTQMGPVSLMALGEWLVVSILRRKYKSDLDNVSAGAQELLHGYVSMNALFYQTLGAAIVDAKFLQAFNQGQEAQYGFRLRPPDRAALAGVLGDANFAGACGKFHDETWDDTCKDMVDQSVDRYSHAIENPFPG
jgi:hypothetical protein